MGKEQLNEKVLATHCIDGVQEGSYVTLIVIWDHLWIWVFMSLRV